MDIEGFIAWIVEDARDHGWSDIDGGSLYEALVRHGLCVERAITAEEAKEDWALDYDLREGDEGCFDSPELSALRQRVRDRK